MKKLDILMEAAARLGEDKCLLFSVWWGEGGRHTGVVKLVKHSS